MGRDGKKRIAIIYASFNKDKPFYRFFKNNSFGDRSVSIGGQIVFKMNKAVMCSLSPLQVRMVESNIFHTLHLHQHGNNKYIENTLTPQSIEFFYYVSQPSNNIRDVCFKNDIDLHSLHTVSIGEMNNRIIRNGQKV